MYFNRQILCMREHLFAIHAAQTKHKSFKNTYIIVKKVPTKLCNRKRGKSGGIKKRLKRQVSPLPPIVKVAAMKRYTRDQLLSMQSFIQHIDFKQSTLIGKGHFACSSQLSCFLSQPGFSVSFHLPFLPLTFNLELLFP